VLPAEFMASTRSLLVREMGTETAAPLLYWLIRTVRPRHVLEVGMGYTTPFLAQALQDNANAFAAEKKSLTEAVPNGELALEYPHYYEDPHEPELVCVDRLSDAASSAPKVLGVLDDLGLAHRCHVIEGDLRECGPQVRERLAVVDFAWIDTWDTLAFVREYWDLINPAGGILAVHYLMTYPEGRMVLRYLESLRGPDGGRLEVTNLLEPHKVGQNSTTLIRRVRDYTEPDDLRPASVRTGPSPVRG